ncbi:uncharacterized protein [Temnothorax nylanderi]|uniref:uncharacterized protein isoform X2 n=1 Tax=Temnothorax nylanderi TaxID=102681 RepID=UPI003A87592B
MVVTCAVPKCKSCKTKKKKLSMFKVPTDIEMRKKWKAAIPGIVAFKKTHTVCEKHFEAHYIIRSYIKHDANGKVIANVPFQRPRLHSSAVPTIFDDNTSFIYNKADVPELFHTTESHQSIIGTSDEVTTKKPRIDLASDKVTTKRPCIDFGDEVVHVELSSSCDQQKSSEIASAEVGVSMSVNDRSFLTFAIDPRVIMYEEAWKNALKTEKMTSYMKVCSRHFQKEDYILPDVVAKTRRLKTTAVPSCNLPSSATRKTPSVAEADEARLQKQIRRKMLREMEKSKQVDRDTENNESTDPLKSVELPPNVTNSEINTEMIHCHQIKEEPMDNNEGKIETYNEEGVCSGNTEYYCHQIKKEPTDNNEGQTESYNEEGVCSGNIEYCEDNKNFVFINVGKIDETEGYKQEGACNETIEYCEDNEDSVSINIDNVEKTEGHVKKDMHNQSIGHSKTKNLVDGTLNSTKKGKRSEAKKDETQGNIPTVLTGRFPVNFSFMWSEIHRTFKEHTRVVDCQFKYWKLVHYTHRGLRTEFFFKCQRCLYVASVWSDPINFEAELGKTKKL